MTLDSTSSSLSHSEWRSVVYGPFFNLSLGTLVVNEKSPRPKKPSAAGRIFRFVAPILVGLPVLARTLYLLFGCLSTTYVGPLEVIVPIGRFADRRFPWARIISSRRYQGNRRDPPKTTPVEVPKARSNREKT